MRRPILLGHRGARATRSIPENTLASFEQALSHGCDGFELDVRFTADSCAVICHDPEVKGKAVARANADDLRDLAVLDDVLKRYSSRAFLDIELKVGGGEQKVQHAIRQHDPQRGFVVSSFQPEILVALHAVDDTLPLGLISDRKTDLEVWRELPIQFVIPHHSLVTNDLTENLHRAGKKVFVWTVNDRAAMLQFAEWGVDGLISDDTELLVRTFAER
jgi:glycerophosphoryl diester phosphodiesterase